MAELSDDEVVWFSASIFKWGLILVAPRSSRHTVSQVSLSPRVSSPLVRVLAQWKTNLSSIWQEEIKLTVSVQADTREALEQKKKK